MTNAAQGNPMIPVHPEVAAQRAAAGAQTPPASNPQANGAPAQAPQTDGIDWFALANDLDGEVPQSTNAPQGQAGQPQQQSGQPPAAQPPQELTAEQKLALAESNGGQPGQPTNAQPPAAQIQPQQVVDHLVNTTYKLSDEQKRKLISEPDVEIPRMLASLHVQVATQLAQYMQQYVTQAVPGLAMQHVGRQIGAMKAEQVFFSQYPALNRQEFRPVVLQMLKYAKGMNPTYTREQVMKEAAEMAAFKLRVSLNPQGAQAPSQPPARPMTPAQVPPQSAPMPFLPAAAGGAPQAPQAGSDPNANPFELLAADPNW